ncbi:MAG: cell division/cell wall cluster transcriptional repressor MraZ [Deltaproteobacteria bacterium]|jgi:MraZ protein|nr:cell division/cell wall cluster transcriptional repressor MraZ [Deltaproteobacteria bacterium]
MVQGAPIDFFGEANHSLDDKGRLTLPVPVRDNLRKSSRPDQMWLGWMPGDACVNVYPVETMEELEAEWSDPSRFQSTGQHMDFLRLWKSRLEIVTLDKAGRILLPASKRELAGIKKDVVVSGNGSKFEIWDPEALNAKRAKAEERYLAARAAEDAQAASGDAASAPGTRLPRC